MKQKLKDVLGGSKRRTIGTMLFRGDLYVVSLRHHPRNDCVEFRFTLMPGKELPLCARFHGDADFREAVDHVLHHSLLRDAELKLAELDVPSYCTC